MAAGEFQVVFHGGITGDQPVEVVKQQLANLFRMSPERIEALFSGKPVVVKKNIDEATARKLEQAFLRAGAACEVRGPAATTAQADAGRTTAAPAEAAANRAAPAERTDSSIAAAGDPNRTLVDLAVPDSFEGLEMDTSDAPLATPTEQPAPEIDTSGLSLAADDAGPLSERKPPPPADIDTSGLSMESLDGEH